MLISTKKYTVRFAEGEEDIKQAQRLRYRVFNVELGEGLDSSTYNERDADCYDPQCDHLLVIDNASGTVIGTYRMQTCEMAAACEGFYTQKEFCLNTLPQKVLASSVEVGRACVAIDHRNGRVLYLLWRGLARYLLTHHKQYLFGCCSLTSQSCREGWQVMSYLRQNKLLHHSFALQTTDEFYCPKPADFSACEAPHNTTLPQLFRLYMDLGARVCSEPAIDRDFKTIDFLILLDINALDERTRLLFFN